MIDYRIFCCFLHHWSTRQWSVPMLADRQESSSVYPALQPGTPEKFLQCAFEKAPWLLARFQDCHQLMKTLVTIIRGWRLVKLPLLRLGLFSFNCRADNFVRSLVFMLSYLNKVESIVWQPLLCLRLAIFLALFMVFKISLYSSHSIETLRLN